MGGRPLFRAFLSLGLLLTAPAARAEIKYQDKNTSVEVKSLIDGFREDQAQIKVPLPQRLNFLIADQAMDSSEETMGYQIRRLEKFVDGPIFYNRVSDWNEVGRLLTTHHDEAIQSVYFDFHGNEETLFISGNYLTVNKERVNKVLGTPRFMPGALLVFTSCNVVPKDKYEATYIFRALREGLSMKSGVIYFNYQEGDTTTDDTQLTPFYDLPEHADWKLKASAIISQIFPVIAVPVHSLREHYLTNNGYIYGFDESRDREILVPAHLFDARRGIIKN